jgi:radical SAM superfamily enzyme YgiQ (UPF0313 family)
MPLGACVIAESALKAGYDIRFMDMMFLHEYQNALEKELEWKPQVIGISLRNIDNNDMSKPVTFYDLVRVLVKTIRSRTNAPLVLGGAAAGIMPVELLLYTGVDYVISGNGEESFPLLLGGIERNGVVSQIPGVIWREGHKIRVNQAGKPRYDDCAAPDFSKWIDVRRYYSYLTPAPMQTKRGCPFNCIYCTYGINEGREYNLASTESIVGAVKQLESGGCRDIEFVDNVFNAPYRHALAVCSALRTAKSKVRFHTQNLSPQCIDGKLLSFMKEAGFKSVGITAENISDRVLRNLGKSYNKSHVIKAAKALQRNHVPCMWVFLLGGPGENITSVKQTFSFAKEYVLPQDVVFFNIGIRIYPGTKLEKIARQEGVLVSSRHDMLEPVSYFSSDLSREWLENEMNAQLEANKNFIDSGSLIFPLLPVIYRIGGWLGFSHPLWRHTRRMRTALNYIGVHA